MLSSRLVPGYTAPDLCSIAKASGQAEKFAAIDEVRRLYERVKQYPDGFSLKNLLTEMQVKIRVDARDLKCIPDTGPVLIVANHPFGILDGAALSVVLQSVRQDVKVLTNFLLCEAPEVQNSSILVDRFQSDASSCANRRPLREAITWIQGGGALVIFPAGEVSQLLWSENLITDPTWNRTAIRLLRKTCAPSLPVYFCGRNSVGFHVSGLIHPRFRTLLLLREFLQQKGKTVEIRIGNEIQKRVIDAIKDDDAAIEYLRWRTYLLGRRSVQSKLPTPSSSHALNKACEAIVSRVDPTLLEKELASLAKDRCLIENGNLCVFLVRASEGPHLQNEIGRLRELTFREVGEGTGKRCDLDRYDLHYWHFVLWDKAQRQVVGAYRAANTVEVLPEHGIEGLYTNELFRFDPEFFHTLGPALELGRSFIRREYQRHYTPLLLLWKGIARWVAEHPDTTVLFGAVSISNRYNKWSRRLIHRFSENEIAKNDEARSLSRMLKPRRRFRSQLLWPWHQIPISPAIAGMEDLSDPIADVESDRKGLPVLLRQYAKVGGKLLAFNVDHRFSRVLDGLVVVDLRRTDFPVLERYMGRRGSQSIQEHHGLNLQRADR